MVGDRSDYPQALVIYWLFKLSISINWLASTLSTNAVLVGNQFDCFWSIVAEPLLQRLGLHHFQNSPRVEYVCSLFGFGQFSLLRAVSVTAICYFLYHLTINCYTSLSRFSISFCCPDVPCSVGGEGGFGGYQLYVKFQHSSKPILKTQKWISMEGIEDVEGL